MSADAYESFFEKLDTVEAEKEKPTETPAPKTIPNRYEVSVIYAIRHHGPERLFRFGKISNMHSVHALSAHPVFLAVPTLRYDSEMRGIESLFGARLSDQGWYTLFEHEVKDYLLNHILARFNEDMYIGYATTPAQTPIPEPKAVYHSV